MEKSNIRKTLFNKYFETKSGITITDLTDSMDYISNCWKQLHKLLEENIPNFNTFSKLYTIEKINDKNKEYLVIKLDLWNYLIIDIKEKKVITKNIPAYYYDNFSNTNDLQKNKKYNINYSIVKYNGNIQNLIDFYNLNEKILNIPAEITYKLEIKNAYTLINMDFKNSIFKIDFKTKDLALYEELFLRTNLTPYKMQSIQSEISIEEIQKIIYKMQSIKIPKKCIPEKLYQYFLNKNDIDKENNKQKKLYIY